jgi:predicted metalloprotease with PDZ domain
LGFLFAAVQAWGATAVTCASPASPQSEPTEYFVSLADAPTHVAHVSIRFPSGGASVKLDMPVWNALYQVRNFAANVMSIRAEDAAGSPLTVTPAGSSEWLASSAPGDCLVVHYDVHLDSAGPFGSQLNAEHGFFNWAMVLMYSPELRSRPASLRLLDVPAAWAWRDTHVLNGGEPGKAQDAFGIAGNYDTLVDTPAEASAFCEYSFHDDGATYHIVVHADPADYDAAELQDSLKRITHAAVEWMADRPYGEYTFLYHFPRRAAGGGMEHAYGSAIDVSAASGKVSSAAVAEVSAHEFFHLWNVKRIRPQSLEPIDYQVEQDSTALWFSEGVTSTVADLLRVRAGLIDEQQFLGELSGEITELEQRPARQWQSAEASSLDAWFEGNAFYRTAERSVSYYNQGNVLGVLLDLRIRQLTDGRKSLRDLFLLMNAEYAKQHRFFPDSDGVQQAAEKIAGQSFAGFFRDYIAGVEAIPYDRFFEFVGLELLPQTLSVVDPGFEVTGNLGGEPEVSSLAPDSDAAHAGLQTGDRILEVNGHPTMWHPSRELQQLHPGDTAKLRISRAGQEHTLKVKMGSRQEQQYVLQDVPGVTALQLSRRRAWVHGDEQGGGQ